MRLYGTANAHTTEIAAWKQSGEITVSRIRLWFETTPFYILEYRMVWYNVTMAIVSLHPQDVVVLLKLVANPSQPWTYLSLAEELALSPSQVHTSLRRAELARLYNTDSKRIARRSLGEFLIHGVKYAFPAQIGGQTRGAPTGYAAPPLNALIHTPDSDPPVWPSPTGTVRGYQFEPLYKGAVFAAERDPTLYELLALVDAVRDGRSREANLAVSLLKTRLDIDDEPSQAGITGATVRRSLVYYIDVEPSVRDGEIIKKQARIAAASGCSVQVVSYRDLIHSPASIAAMRAQDVLAWFVSGSFTEWKDYPPDDLTAVMRLLKEEPGAMPMLGVCAGHQLIAMAYGAEIAHMSGFDAGKSPPDVACPEAFASPPFGWKTREVTLNAPSDPIFLGLPTRKFNFSHHDEVTTVPSGFKNLARTAECPVQLLKQDDRLVYTTQFHPEFEVPLQRDGGETLMRNFFAMARKQWGE